MEPIVTEDQIDMMLRALGSAHAPDRADMGWRNYCVTGEPDCRWEDLVQKGLAVYHQRSVKRNCVYSVSDLGLRLLGVTPK